MIGLLTLLLITTICVSIGLFLIVSCGTIGFIFGADFIVAAAIIWWLLFRNRP